MDPFFLHEEPDKEEGKSSAEEKKKGKKEKKQTAKGKRKQKEQEEKQQAAVEDEEEDEVQEEAHEGENEEDEGEGDEKQAKPGRKSRKNKPIEMSSKVPVSRFRQIVPPSRPKPRDPRFEETAGPYSEHIFKATYKFLEEQKKQEEAELRAELARTRNEDRKAEIRRVLDAYRQEALQRERRNRLHELRAQWRKQQKKRAKAAGKELSVTPFLKKEEEQKLMLAERFLELKKSGKLSEVMAKKRKKNAAKDHRWMPYQE